MQHSTQAPVALSIYTSRESIETLLSAFKSIPGALGPLKASVDVIVNGAPALAIDAARAIASEPRRAGVGEIAVWSLPLGDKAHAWNEGLHAVRREADMHVYMDGYVILEPGAIHALVGTLAAAPGGLAVTGRPLSGRSASYIADVMKTRGGIHGNLFALIGKVVESLRACGFRLPLGMYRGDSAISGVVALGAGVEERVWRADQRLVFAEGARWRHEALQWWKPDDLRTQYRRWRRQQQGRLENAALSHFLHAKAKPFNSLPRTIDAMVKEWAQQEPDALRVLLAESPLLRLGLKDLLRQRDWSLADRSPISMLRTSVQGVVQL